MPHVNVIFLALKQLMFLLFDYHHGITCLAASASSMPLTSKGYVIPCAYTGRNCDFYRGLAFYAAFARACSALVLQNLSCAAARGTRGYVDKLTEDTSGNLANLARASA